MWHSVKITIKKETLKLLRRLNQMRTGFKKNTLFYWLKQDDPEYFKQLRKGNNNEIYDIAKK